MGWNQTAQDFHHKIHLKLAHLSQYKRKGEYYIYSISEPAPKGIHLRERTTFYVGQSSNMLRRAKNHLGEGGSAESNTNLYRHIYHLLKHKIIPQFDVIETVSTRLLSLNAEQQWAIKFTNSGSDLKNEWPEHKVAPAYKYDDGTSVPTERLWDMSIRDAYISNIKLIINCHCCGLKTPLPLDAIGKFSWTKRLNDIRRIIACPTCNDTNCLKIQRNMII
jgi:hypothetical protein